MTKTARIFEDVGGYHVCSDELDHLDARGPAYKTKAEALRIADYEGYTHATGSGCPWDGVRRIPAKYRDQ
jgi:hypothetical protein